MVRSQFQRNVQRGLGRFPQQAERGTAQVSRILTFDGKRHCLQKYVLFVKQFLSIWNIKHSSVRVKYSTIVKQLFTKLGLRIVE